MPLTGKQRRQLRGLGHGMPPVVQIGKSGLSESVKKAIDEQLLAHELIKVRRAADCPLDKHAIAAAIESDLVRLDYRNWDDFVRPTTERHPPAVN